MTKVTGLKSPAWPDYRKRYYKSNEILRELEEKGLKERSKRGRRRETDWSSCLSIRRRIPLQEVFKLKIGRNDSQGSLGLVIRWQEKIKAFLRSSAKKHKRRNLLWESTALDELTVNQIAAVKSLNARPQSSRNWWKRH